MSGSGLSQNRLDRLHGVMAGRIERGELSGLVTLISRRGETYVDAIGTMAVGGEPMRHDAIFRIASMTKPITAVAAMILVEECRLRLDDPVDGLLPELAGRRVLRRLDGPLDETVPAHRPITLRDLLSFRMGFGMILGSPDEYPILRALEERQIFVGPPQPATPLTPDEWLRRLGELPLMDQPGERWRYDGGSLVLGVLIDRAAGQSLGSFLHERIFAPLGMVDTAFYVPAHGRDRLPTCYAADPATGQRIVRDAAGGQWSQPPIFPNAAAGLVSTAGDYLAFGEMLLGQGRRGDARILSRPSVAAMTTDQLRAGEKVAPDFFPGDPGTRGWGFGVAVVTKRDDPAASPGRFGWTGGYGTSAYVDPAEGLIGILMTQQEITELPPKIERDFWTAAYAAIDD